MTIEKTDVLAVLKRIEKAKSFKELLDGDNPGKAYRLLAKICHPDVVPEHLKNRATIAFGNLSVLYEAMNGGPKDKSAAVIAGYVVKSPLAKGDICDLYIVESVRDDNAVLKIVRSSADNDLLEREIATLKEIHAAPENKIQHYAPKVLNTFKASGRRAVVLPYEEGFHSLHDIAAMHSAGLDFRHIIWMGNRVLSILGFIHRLGIVHGAVLPSHLLYHGISHDLRLVDWCYSTKVGSTIPARVKRSAGYYPPEVDRKLPASPATDIYMMARSLEGVAQKVPMRFRHLFQYCTAASPASRPADAWALQEELWASTAKKEFGPAAYIQLNLTVS